MKTPYFLVSKNKLDENIKAFQNALQKIWPNSELGYSVKTNSLPWLLDYLNNNNVFAEVVSDEEYTLAKQCGYSDEHIIFNGPIKSKEMLELALKNGAYVNIDSKSDLDCIMNIAPEGATVGVRVNIEPQIFREEDIAYNYDGFRFGFAEKNGDLKNAIDIVKKYAQNVKLGLHLHCNSVTRSLEVYKAIAQYVKMLICKYNLDLDFLDFGGGFFGGIEGKPTAEEYVLCIKETLGNSVNCDKTKLILEPGSAIIGSVVDLYTSVLDVKDTGFARIVTTDGSRIHIDPLWKKERYTYSIKQKRPTKLIEKQIICGYTCMDHDRLMILDNAEELKIGDEIIYHRVGAYSMTFGGMFISYYPDVYVEYDKKAMKVRSYSDVGTYIKIHS